MMLDRRREKFRPTPYRAACHNNTPCNSAARISRRGGNGKDGEESHSTAYLPRCGIVLAIISPRNVQQHFQYYVLCTNNGG